jgi:hypothetical protein
MYPQLPPRGIHEPALLLFTEECQRRSGVLPRTNSLSKRTRHRCSQSQGHVSNLETHRRHCIMFVAQRQERQVNGEIFFLPLSTKAENMSSQLIILFHIKQPTTLQKAYQGIPTHTRSNQHPQVYQHFKPANTSSTSQAIQYPIHQRPQPQHALSHSPEHHPLSELPLLHPSHL